MKEALFRSWLQREGYDSGTINSRISNCFRICEAEGDLDILFEQNKYEDLIMRLSYSTQDERNNAKPKHNIKINGNMRTGSATLKQAAMLYRKFILHDSSDFAEIEPTVINATTKHGQAFEKGDKKVVDSYSLFLEYFNIDRKSFYSFGVENTIFASLDFAETQWEQTKEKLLNNQALAIRGYGRGGANTEIFLNLYKHLFNNENIFQDPTNNSAARKNLQAATGHRINKSVFNFQCSHIFGCTKNPLLFESVWNICFVPRLFDPFTGHESKGDWAKEYQEVFIKKVCIRHKEFIVDYNSFLREHNITERINEYINKIKTDYDEKLMTNFSRDACKEWGAITN